MDIAFEWTEAPDPIIVIAKDSIDYAREAVARRYAREGHHASAEIIRKGKWDHIAEVVVALEAIEYYKENSNE